MARTLKLLPIAAGAALVAPGAAQQTSALAGVQPGLWSISGVPDSAAALKMCVGDIVMLARFEHRSHACTSRVIRSSGSRTEIDYSCGGAGFGQSDITTITPRSLRIVTQGISAGLPFNYVLQAHRLGDCPSPVRH